ncbi:dirigent protein 21-like [Salvia miltiorrhiza]|uniref:dirigent protein 21-like n=1 Tax=Salvia miltiorrhiza TaxID=226208 RepID=UPI0025ACD6D9|nr:dirigent protein 21-like [Salvia miltiorrhiza]
MEKLSRTIFFIIFYLFISTPNANARNLGVEKVARLHVYVHDFRAGGPSATVFTVANASITATSPTGFGAVRVVDDLVTAGRDIKSAAVGRVQGLTTSADLKVSAVAVNFNFVFTSGKYNGSTVSIAGRNEFQLAARELPVIGGTGLFRLARGYAITSSYSFDVPTNYAVLEYKIYVVYSKVQF